MEVVSMKKEFINGVLAGVVARSDLMSLRAVLVDFKVRGMPKDEMLECLENLRAAADENIILELMDFVEGYCIKDLSIY